MSLRSWSWQSELRNFNFLIANTCCYFEANTSTTKQAKKNTSLKPPLFRLDGLPKARHSDVLRLRFEQLQRAETLLVEQYRGQQSETERLRRQRILRWSILQHYGVCPTPLLDVTHSLRIAASFASDGATDEAFVFVLGVPNLSGAITASAEAGLQIVRLSSVCPPSALRPHIQEGYLLGEYPDMSAYDQKQNYALSEIDFGRRLVAKFRFNLGTFWKKDEFPLVSHAALYPDRNDELLKLTKSIKQSLPIVD